MDALDEQTALLTRFAAGELEAFEALFRQFQGEVYGSIVRMVRDSGVAEDLTVETFWRIHRARARFDPSRNFGAWARRIAGNVALDHLKSARAQESKVTEALPEEIASESANHSLVNPAIRRELHDRTQLAFQQLPANLRVVATLALIEDCPQGKIAETLGLSTAAVKSRLFRATRLLRRKLSNLGMNHE